MSSLTEDLLAVKAQQRLLESGKALIEIPTLKTFIAEALKEQARAVAYRADYEELKKNLAVSCVNGTITLSDATLLKETIPLTGSLIINGIVSKAKQRYEELFLTWPKDTYHHAPHAGNIAVKNVTDGLLGTAGGGSGIAGVLSVNYVATLAQIPSRYDPELVDQLVKIALDRTTKKAPQGEMNVNLNPHQS